MISLNSLEASIGYQFKSDELIQLALTHRSVSGSHNNERLEFLGDSVLNFIIGEALYQKFPDAKEGQLSRLRASMVKGTTLAELGQQFQLNSHIRVGPGELKSGGTKRHSTLADAVEAIIGAIYLESGFEVCQQVVGEWFASRINRLSLTDTVKDNKTRLQEILQARKLPLPGYHIVSIQGKSHCQSFKVECTIESVPETFTGEGTSRRHAEQQAAGKALKVLESALL
ncbi:MAG: ribonuclease III [Gammaproteobacteria bacterium]|nr:MAG: ribonuclease III [Gammaproteobacteria bacterium]